MLGSKWFFPFLMLVFMTLACAIPGLAQPGADIISTAAAQTVIAGLTQNVTATFTPGITPSLTPTFTPTLIYLTPRFPSETPSSTPLPGTQPATVEVSATPTFAPVEIRVTRPTHCRSGPGKAFEIVGSFLVGMKAEVIGRDPTGQYFYIPNPYVFTDYCWVSGKYAEFTRDPNTIPVVSTPPTPTGTGTAIPSIDYKIKGGGFQSCNGIFWMNIEITSLSALPFQSVQVQLQDADKGITRTLATDNFVAATGCDGLTVNDTISIQNSVLISSAKFDYNFKGSQMHATITVCTEDGLKGVCSIRKGTFNP
ncbi:MAG: hypothetical protein HXY38_05645 [Chloroflexi bacterium]|nr:hypothetical protein [Chloroflexota bacterium]